MNAWAEPDPLVYRYSVKCDRERYHAIEKVARARGLTSNQLVQQHFETILTFEPEQEPAKPVQTPADREEIEVAARYGMSAGALRVYRAVRAASDKTSGLAEIGIGTIACRTGLRDTVVRQLLSRLMAAGHLRRVGIGLRRTAVYEVAALEDAPEAGRSQ